MLLPRNAVKSMMNKMSAASQYAHLDFSDFVKVDIESRGRRELYHCDLKSKNKIKKYKIIKYKFLHKILLANSRYSEMQKKAIAEMAMDQKREYQTTSIRLLVRRETARAKAEGKFYFIIEMNVLKKEIDLIENCFTCRIFFRRC